MEKQKYITEKSFWEKSQSEQTDEQSKKTKCRKICEIEEKRLKAVENKMDNKKKARDRNKNNKLD